MCKELLPHKFLNDSIFCNLTWIRSAVVFCVHACYHINHATFLFENNNLKLHVWSTAMWNFTVTSLHILNWTYYFKIMWTHIWFGTNISWLNKTNRSPSRSTLLGSMTTCAKLVFLPTGDRWLSSRNDNYDITLSNNDTCLTTFLYHSPVNRWDSS